MAGLFDFAKDDKPSPFGFAPRQKKDRNFLYNLYDNIAAIDDGVTTPGERLRKGAKGLVKSLASDPLGTVGRAAMTVKGDLDNLMFEGGAMERPEDVLGYAALGAGGSLGKMGASSAPKATTNLASRREKLYNFPTQSEVGDALGRQHTGGLDLEGRPLVARHVVGRTPDRTLDQSLPSEALAEIVQGQTGRGIEIVPASALPGRSAGAYIGNRHTGKPQAVRARNDLGANTDGVVRHETGHLLDEVSGQIPVNGLSKELKPLYNYGLEGRDRTSNFTEPKHLKYTAEEAPRENMAEALRQYMSAPDAMKERAPKTAARIREYINEHPELSKLIQFNILGGAAYLGSQHDQKGQMAQVREYLARANQ